MARIFLVRHGETQWNREGRFQGALDSPLTARGVEQAHALGRRLAGVAGTVAIEASPLGRAARTAAIVAGHVAGATVRSDARLREVSLGSWDGQTLDEIEAGWPGMLDESTPFDWFFRSPDGESFEAAEGRVRSWLDGVERDVIAVSHGLVGRILRGAWLGLPREEALSLPVPQDVIWLLDQGRVEAIPA